MSDTRSLGTHEGVALQVLSVLDKASKTRFGLSVYDVTYLQIAQQTGWPLATLYKALRSAAKTCGVTLLSSAADRST